MLSSVCNFIDTFLAGKGGWGKIKIKDHLSPTEPETWAELGNNKSITLLSFALVGSIMTFLIKIGLDQAWIQKFPVGGDDA